MSWAARKRTWEDLKRDVASKRSGKATTTSKKSMPAPATIMVQRMSSVPNRSKKYDPLDTRDFVDFSVYTELSFENIKDACEGYYEVPQGSCDVLLSDRGPSCFLTEQVAGKKLYYVRFTDILCPAPSKVRKTTKIDADRDEIRVHSQDIAQEISSLPPVPPTAFRKSVSVATLLEARKLITPPDVTRTKLRLESFNVAEKKWVELPVFEVTKENKPFAKGGFREAFLATEVLPNNKSGKKWVVKTYKSGQMDKILTTIGMTAEQHTRKQVQMHCVAHNIAVSMLRKCPVEFGESFSYNKVYFSSMEGVPITAEEYIPGRFVKYINNNGRIANASSLLGKTLLQKAECFAHFSYIHTQRKMMVLDLQGVDYMLCDPEISTSTLVEDGELNFCSGNLSTDAMTTFFEEHKCNSYCELIKLAAET
eukprot:Seg3046.1 transcript_id=Seg3046.1/GoldUCD/mRNA.D3Y31 product="Eukaryotic elongation factor 2 kinase" protein_id=Seg3046.1/GoldUCD/D3Y31